MANRALLFQAILIGVALLALGAAAEPQCEEYSYKTEDTIVEGILVESEKTSIDVGDWHEIQDVHLRTRMLVKKFNGVEISLTAVPPEGVPAGPQNTVVLKKMNSHNPSFFREYNKPLMLEVLWSDDAALTLGEALSKMTIRQRQLAKTEFVQVLARPDTSLRHLVTGSETSASNGGSRGSWQLNVENKALVAKRRNHAKVQDWSLTLCFGPTSSIQGQLVSALEEEAGSVVYDPVPGYEAVAPAPERRGFFGRRRRGGFGSRLFGGASAAQQTTTTTAPQPRQGLLARMAERRRNRSPFQRTMGYATGLSGLVIAQAAAEAAATGLPLATVLSTQMTTLNAQLAALGGGMAALNNGAMFPVYLGLASTDDAEEDAAEKSSDEPVAEVVDEPAVDAVDEPVDETTAPDAAPEASADVESELV